MQRQRYTHTQRCCRLRCREVVVTYAEYLVNKLFCSDAIPRRICILYALSGAEENLLLSRQCVSSSQLKLYQSTMRISAKYAQHHRIFNHCLRLFLFPCLSFLLEESLRCTSVFSAVFPSNNYVLCLHLDMWFCLAKKKHTQKALLSPTGFIYRIRQTNRIKEKS